MGSSPATQPTPNDGFKARGIQKLSLTVQALTDLLADVGAATDEGQAVLDAIKKLSKFVVPGAVTPAAQGNQIRDMAMRNVQNGQQMATLQQQQSQQQAA